MNAMLATIFLCVIVGMAATRWRIPILPATIVIGTFLTAVYLFLPRYM